MLLSHQYFARDLGVTTEDALLSLPDCRWRMLAAVVIPERVYPPLGAHPVVIRTQKGDLLARSRILSRELPGLCGEGPCPPRRRITPDLEILGTTS